MKFPKDVKILFLDIETMPNIAAVWQTGYKLNVDAGAILQERFILSAQWSWNNEAKVHGELSNIKKKDDRKLVTKITKLIEEADVVVGHNVKKFDLRWIAGRALLNGQAPTGSKFVKTIDTLAVAKQAFYLNSYRLDYIAKALGVPGKTKTSFGDWLAILKDGNMERAKYLLKYGCHDVKINRQVFIKLLGHVKLPKKMDMLIHGKSTVCPDCHGFNVHSKGQRSNKDGALIQRYVCVKCGHDWGLKIREDKHGKSS